LIKDWLAVLWKRIRHFREDRDLEDELRAHLAMLAEDHLESGLPPIEARRRARLQFGNTQVVVERIRDQEFATVLEGWYRDFVFGLRALRRSPVFCLTAILTLALGIGANTAVFTLLYGLLLRSLPVPDAHRLARISMVSSALTPATGSYIPYLMLRELQGQQRSFTDISAWIGNRISMEDVDGALRFQTADLVSGNAFEVLAMKPYMGRLIAPVDDVHGVPAMGWPVVLSYGFWKDRFGADPEIIGQPIKLSNAIATVVGVTPRNSTGCRREWIPNYICRFNFSRKS
jgi:hypothetical protein